jgi:sensor histidine kinase YesM
LPPLLLQPLVENALKHGIEPRLDGGEVKVSAREEDGRLLLEVEDKGLIPAHGARGAPAGPGEGGARTAATAGSGVGLANVRARLAAAFAGAQFEAGPNPAGGYTVRLSIPR